MLEIRNIKLGLDDDEQEIGIKIGKKLNISPSDINIIKILRRSIDARNKGQIHFIYNLLVDIKSEKKLIKKWIQTFDYRAWRKS